MDEGKQGIRAADAERMASARQVFVLIVLVFFMFASFEGNRSILAQEIGATETPVKTATATVTFVPTPTVSGPSILVPDRVNVRSGPGTNYEKVGVLVAGQFARAIGRTSFGEWIAIEYPVGTNDYAWVYSPLVVVQEAVVDELPEVDLPPTPTLPALPVAALTLSPEDTLRVTQLPTFTPAPPVAQPTFVTPNEDGGALPPIVLIAGLFSLGIISGIVAILRQRS